MPPLPVAAPGIPARLQPRESRAGELMAAAPCLRLAPPARDFLALAAASSSCLLLHITPRARCGIMMVFVTILLRHESATTTVCRCGQQKAAGTQAVAQTQDIQGIVTEVSQNERPTSGI